MLTLLQPWMQTLLHPRFEAPVDIGRDEARERAVRELTERVYADAEPSWWQRASSWAWRQLAELLDGASGAVSGIGWVLLLALLVTGVIVVIVLRTGAIQRQRRAPSATVFGDALRPASEHRADAERAGLEGRWDAAVIESFRAVARRLEERGILDPRPGRTADETVNEAARYFPALAEQLADAARNFDAVAYGEHPGTPAVYQHLVQLDDDVRVTRPVVTA